MGEIYAKLQSSSWWPLPETCGRDCHSRPLLLCYSRNSLGAVETRYETDRQTHFPIISIWNDFSFCFQSGDVCCQQTKRATIPVCLRQWSKEETGYPILIKPRGGGGGRHEKYIYILAHVFTPLPIMCVWG